MMAYIGAEGYLANTELREGKQHSQKGTLAFLRKTLSIAHQLTEKSLLVRIESGNDIADNLGILIEDESWFAIKRNLCRTENKEERLTKVKECCKDIRQPRVRKDVYVGSSWKDVSYKTSDGEEKNICVKIVYEVIEHTIDKHGRFLLIADIEDNTFWTNLGDSDDDIIGLYHAHGESEQYHSETMTDMDIERLPPGKFDTKELILELSLLAYNILRIIG